MKRNIFYLMPILFCWLACSNQSHQNELHKHIVNKPVKLSFENVHKYYATDNCSEESTNCSYFVVNYPKVNSKNFNGAAELNHQIEAEVLELLKPLSSNKTEDSLSGIANGFLNRFLKFKKDYPQSGQYWYLKINGRVIWQSDNFLTIKFTYQDYTGGAHPNYGYFYKTYDKRNNHAVTLGDLTSNPEKIRLMAETQFRKEKNIKAETPLSKSKFHFDGDKFSLNNNFGLDSTGLLFLYNPYEIAAYSEGTTKIHLPYTELRGLLKPDVH